MASIRVLQAVKSKGGRAHGGRHWQFLVLLRTAAGDWTPIYKADFLRVKDYLVRNYSDAEIAYQGIDF